MLNQQPTLDRIFHALSDPSRRAMLERVSRGPATVSELAEPLDMSLAAVMQHLTVLEESGVVRTQKVGRVRTCRVEPKAFAQAEAWISQRRSQWERHFDRLGEFLAEQDKQDKSDKDRKKKP